MGAQLSALPGAFLLPALLTFPAALRGHQAAEELRGQHGRGPPARSPLAAPGALGLLPRASGVSDEARERAGGRGAARAPAWVSASTLRPRGRPGSGARLGCSAGRHFFYEFHHLEFWSRAPDWHAEVRSCAYSPVMGDAAWRGP